MHFHLRIRRWVLWWFIIGVIGGAIALANILVRRLTHTQEDALLLFGAAHWVLGGLVCYAWDAVRIGESPEPPADHFQPKSDGSRREEREGWHSASDFLLPGNRKSLLPPGLRH